MGKSRQGIKHTSPPHTQTRTHWHTHTHVNSNWSNELCICSCPHTTRMRMQSLPRRRCAACCTDPFGICTLMCPIYIGSYPYTMLSFSTMLNATSSRSSTGRCWQRRPLWRRRWSQLRLSLRLTAAAAGESASLCVCVYVYTCVLGLELVMHIVRCLYLSHSHTRLHFETLTLFLSFSLSLILYLSLCRTHSYIRSHALVRHPIRNWLDSSALSLIATPAAKKAQLELWRPTQAEAARRIESMQMHCTVHTKLGVKINSNNYKTTTTTKATKYEILQPVAICMWNGQLYFVRRSFA